MIIEAVVLLPVSNSSARLPRASQGGTSRREGGGKKGEGKAKALGRRKGCRDPGLILKLQQAVGPHISLRCEHLCCDQGEFSERVKQTLTDREALIKDRIRTIIAQSDPEKLGGGSEPGPKRCVDK